MAKMDNVTCVEAPFITGGALTIAGGLVGTLEVCMPTPVRNYGDFTYGVALRTSAHGHHMRG